MGTGAPGNRDSERGPGLAYRAIAGAAQNRRTSRAGGAVNTGSGRPVTKCHPAHPAAATASTTTTCGHVRPRGRGRKLIHTADGHRRPAGVRPPPLLPPVPRRAILTSSGTKVQELMEHCCPERDSILPEDTQRVNSLGTLLHPGPGVTWSNTHYLCPVSRVGWEVHADAQLSSCESRVRLPGWESPRQG